MLFASCYLLPSIAASVAVEGSKKPAARSKNHRIRYVFNLSLLLLGMLMIGGCNSASSGESEIMQGLRKSDHLFETSEIVQTSYFFYPSTMRMVNIDNMPNWNGAIQGVRRLSVLSMWPDRFNRTKENEVVADLETKEGFSLYAEMEDKYSNFRLLGRENGKEAILIYNDSTVNYVVHLLGKVNYVKLMKLFGDLQDMENKGTGLSFLTKAMGRDTDQATRRRHYYDRKKEIEAEKQFRQDSIEAAQATETVIAE